MMFKDSRQKFFRNEKLPVVFQDPHSGGFKRSLKPFAAINERLTPSPRLCALKCLRLSWCKSVNHHRVMGSCELLMTDIRLLDSIEGFSYFFSDKRYSKYLTKLSVFFLNLTERSSPFHFLFLKKNGNVSVTNVSPEKG